MRFENKVALIVGAAGGIAAACARIISAEGGIVVGADRDAAALGALMEELPGWPGARGLALTIDALDEADAARAVRAAVERFGRIDILINTVGGSSIIDNMNATIEELTVEQWKRVVDFNLLPCFLFCRAVARVMKQQGAGKIVNVSSIASTGRTLRNSAYASSKAGVSGLTRKLAWELGPFGITCNDVVPGRTRTPEAEALEAKRDPVGTAAYLQTIPLRRLATPEDPARVICFLASSDADYVTGVSIDVMGGQ